MLALRDVRAGYGEAVVLDGISLEIPEHSSVAILGRNGVGKSTLLQTIMGCTRLYRGELLWRGAPISRRPTHERARLGIGWVAQERDIFPSLTVEENLCVAAGPGRWDLERVYGLFPRLKERFKQLAGTLSGGEQQMVAMGRAILSKPKLLLLDEPSMGLAPIIVQKIFEIIQMISAQGVTMLLVEQNAKLALEISQRGYVMESGRITMSGPARELLDDERVRNAYLGG